MSTDQHTVAPERHPVPPADPASTTDPAQHPASASPSNATRASDAEREAVIARLHTALGEGRLDLDETETRVAAAYAARRRDELPPLLADLPGAGDPAGPRSRDPRWDALRRWVAAVLGGLPARAGALGRARPALLVGLVVAWLLVCGLLGAVAGAL